MSHDAKHSVLSPQSSVLRPQSSVLRVLLLAFLLLILSPFECRRARGVEEDPLDAEAQKNLVDYLRIDTSNPPGHETDAPATVAGRFAELVGSDMQRMSVYARLSSGTNEKALLLLHHIDVVPAVLTEWTKPPFGGTIDGGYIWGRGALDMKSIGIAELMAFIELKRRNVPLKRDVIFLGVADEEMGGAKGTKWLLDTRPDLFANVGYVLNEGGYNDTIVDRVSFWGIEVQQKLPLWIRLQSKHALIVQY